jgi:hypothetical protein
VLGARQAFNQLAGREDPDCSHCRGRRSSRGAFRHNGRSLRIDGRDHRALPDGFRGKNDMLRFIRARGRADSRDSAPGARLFYSIWSGALHWVVFRRASRDSCLKPQPTGRAATGPFASDWPSGTKRFPNWRGPSRETITRLLLGAQAKADGGVKGCDVNHSQPGQAAQRMIRGHK